MISKNGMKFRFSPGEKVLCYEPDPTRSKVLYDSKVLELCISKDKRRKVPEYLIHFSGWSRSWDRCVTEEFILKDCPENRQLQKQLAESAILQIKNKKQRRKLSAILKDSYRYGRRSGMLSSDDDSDESKNSDDSDSDSSYTSASGSEQMEEGPEEEPAVLTLKIPEILKRKLEEDNRQIKQKKKLVKLPCEPNVINILEGYVKTYATNELCLTSDNRRSANKKETNIETNINLCKEVMDGLRIYFDFKLNSNLLYNEEKEQYKYFVNNYEPTPPEICNDKAASITKPLELKLETDLNKGTSDPNQSDAGCLSPTQRFRKTRGDSGNISNPQLSPSPSKQTSIKQIKREAPDDIEVEVPKRVLRSNAVKQEMSTYRAQTLSPTTVDTGAASNSDGSASCNVNTTENDSTKESKPSKVWVRSQPHRQAAAIAEALILKSCYSARSGPMSPLQTNSAASTSSNPEPSTPTGKTFTTNVSVPAPISTRTHLSSISSCSSKSGPSSPISFATTAAQKMTNALNETMQWRMIPSYVYTQKPTPPTLIYGIHHLLRLFVRLPEMVNKTNMPNCNLEVLETHLESFISYLTQRHLDFYPPNDYIDATETLANTVPSISVKTEEAPGVEQK